MNDFGKSHENPPGPEPKPDVDTLRIVLSDISSLAMVHEVEVYVSDYTAKSVPERKPLTGLALDEAIEDLTVNTLNDIREFEHRNGLREGMQLVANRINERIAQANETEVS